MANKSTLGKAPQSFSPSARNYWAELNADCPWLTRSDRHIAAGYCIAAAQRDRLAAAIAESGEAAMSRPEVDAWRAVTHDLRSYLPQLGLTPASRRKIEAAQPPDDGEEADGMFAGW